MEIIDQFRYLVGAYFGVCLMDEYPLKVYILKDIEEYIKEFVREYKIDGFDYKSEAESVKDNVSDRIKLQDCLIVLPRVKAPLELILLIKKRLKEMDEKY